MEYSALCEIGATPEALSQIIIMWSITAVTEQSQAVLVSLLSDKEKGEIMQLSKESHHKDRRNNLTTTTLTWISSLTVGGDSGLTLVWHSSDVFCCWP